MTTPLIMLALLAGPYAAVRLLGRFDSRAAAAYGLALLFVFTGLGHFLQTEAMAQMLPPWVPARVQLVQLTGVLEWGLALGFFIPETRRSAGWMALAVLVAFFPANIYAALNYVPMGGHAWGPEYLLVRAPLQLAIALWVYWFTIRVGSERVLVLGAQDVDARLVRPSYDAARGG
jgi:uncharacterized membrane protein